MRNGLRRFTRDSSCPALLRCPLAIVPGVSPTRLSRSMDGLSRPFGYTADLALSRVLQPRAARCHAPGLGSSAFARRYSRNHCCFLLLRVLRCFSSPRSPRLAAVSGSLPTGSPIRTSAAQWVFAPYRGFSQLVTSFFASESHRHPPCALFAFLFSSRLFYRIVVRSIRSARLLSLLTAPLLLPPCGRIPFKACLRVPSMSMIYFLLSVVPGRLGLPTSTLSV